MRHFIRGCWDGDGSVYLSGGKIGANYVSGSKDFMMRLVDELFKIGIVTVRTSSIPNDELKRLKEIYKFGQYPLRIYEDYRSKNTSYSIKVNSRDNMAKLFHYFYDVVDESMYLKRKYNIFVKGLNLTDEELKNRKKNEYQYPPVSTRPIIIEKKTNKRVMKFNNSEGKLKCFRCGSKAEEMFVTSKPFCRDCFFSDVDYLDYQ